MKILLVLLFSVCSISLRLKPGSGDSHWYGPNGEPNGRPNSGLWVAQIIRPNIGGSQQDENESLGDRPKPESICVAIIPKNVRTTIIAPLLTNKVTVNSVYPCDSDSRLKQISFSGVSLTEPEVTCSGVYVLTNDGEVNYDMTFCDSRGRTRKERLLLTNYTIVSTYNNGNYEFIECGVVLKGRCAGDLWVGSGVYQVDDSNGCASPGGVSGSSALVRKLEIRGKCSSKCGLGSSVIKFSNPVNNLGYAADHLGYFGEDDAPEIEKSEKLIQ